LAREARAFPAHPGTDRSHRRSHVRPDHGTHVHRFAEHLRRGPQRRARDADRALGCNLAWG
jgi:hypothetical protein